MDNLVAEELASGDFYGKDPHTRKSLKYRGFDSGVEVYICLTKHRQHQDLRMHTFYAIPISLTQLTVPPRFIRL